MPQKNNSLNSAPLYILILLIGLLAVLMGARYIGLDADPPPSYIPIDSGFHIDEGYKTFAAKNILVFGQSSWHDYDHYHGWLKPSPLTQWPYYFAFKNFGLELENARLVSAIYFSLFSLFVLFFLNKRYGFLLSVTAAVILASDVALFNFSRSALFETALVLFVYFGIFLISRVSNNRPVVALVALLIPTVIAMFTVKLSAILYCAPTILAFSYLIASGFVETGSKKNKALYFFGLGLFILVIAYVTRSTWMPRIPLDAILHLPKQFMMNPMPDISVMALVLGYGVVLHLLLTRPKALYEDLYRLSLVVTVICTPLILALFKYNPPRYYLVIVPACLLLVVDWLYLQQNKKKESEAQELTELSVTQKVLAVVIFIPFLMFSLRAFNILVMENIPVNIGDDPGISVIGLYRIFPFILLGMFVFLFFMWKKSVVTLRMLIPVFILVHVIYGVIMQVNYLANPSYDSQKIRAQLNSIITDTESVAGDWAPYFTAEAPIRSFYMSININFPVPERVAALKPDYFLHSDSPFDPMSLEYLQSNDTLVLEEPQQLGTYMGRSIQLYKINYQ